MTDQASGQRSDRIAKSFRQFAAEQFEGYSPLYERLSLDVAGDGEMLDFVARAGSGRKVLPLLFLGSVHYLLLKGVQHPLAAFFPSVAGYDSPPASGDPYPALRDFCRQHGDEITALMQSRIVQTNEVQRCACLLPAFTLLAEEVLGRPLALVEIGASAGFHLLWDRYGYDYGDLGRYGDPNSPLQLRCGVRGDKRPPLPRQMPKVASRVGIDLNPVDVRDPDEALWLRALVWPEHRERAGTLEEVVELARQDPPTVIAGDMFDKLPAAMRDAPRDAALLVYHSHTTYMLSQEDRDRLTALIAEASIERPIYRVSLEWLGGETTQLSIYRFAGNTYEEQKLANCQAHGQWLEWLVAATVTNS